MEKREIKFRAAYDGYAYDVTEIMWSEGTAYIVERDGENGETVELEKIQLLQFTGLKDKNGEEIYEGDVVKHWDDGAPDARPCHEQIAWDADTASFVCFHRLDGGRKSWLNFKSTLDSGMEVIGNIYENPELIAV